MQEKRDPKKRRNPRISAKNRARIPAPGRALSRTGHKIAKSLDFSGGKGYNGRKESGGAGRRRRDAQRNGKMGKVGELLKKKDIVFSPKRYGIDALGAMAQGLFCSLLIGTIIKTIGQLCSAQILTDIGTYAMAVSGPAMAVAIGYALKAPPMVLFSLAAVGYSANAEGGAGGPLAVLVIAIVACECGKLVSKETKVDILVTPGVTVFVGVLLAKLIAPPIGSAANAFGLLIDQATKLQPFWMGIAVSVLVGIALTLPISSAAICSVLALTGLAGGAAVAGCCAQMIGFAVISFRENRFGGLVSQGLGTSMLQMPNIVKTPRVWIAPILASAITGPIATCVFRLEMNGAAINSGMGTCGMCGPIGVITGWFAPVEDAVAKGAAAIEPGVMDWVGLVLIAIVLPAVLSLAFHLILRKLGWVKDGDLKLE